MNEPAVYLDKLTELLRVSQWPELRRELQAAQGRLAGEQYAAASVLALQAGLPALAAEWAAGGRQPQVQVAAWLRLGRTAEALEALGDESNSGHAAQVMRARAYALGGDLARAEAQAQAGYRAAFDAGDAAALTAAVALLGELELRRALDTGSRTALHSALNILAEGLNLAEVTREPADPHVLALIALTQRRIKDGPKAQATAAKALDRSLAFSPSAVLALTALGRSEEARGQAEAGALAGGWWVWATAPLPLPDHSD